MPDVTDGDYQPYLKAEALKVWVTCRPISIVKIQVRSPQVKLFLVGGYSSCLGLVWFGYCVYIVYILCIYQVYMLYHLIHNIYTIYTRYIHNNRTRHEANSEELKASPMPRALLFG